MDTLENSTTSTRNEPLGAGGPTVGGRRRAPGSSGRQREYAGVKLRPNSIMICSITREKKT